MTYTHSAKSALFAILIGINKYQNIRHLEGCVADVNDMMKFLMDSMGVPRERIVTLFDEQATRRNIISHIQSLAEEGEIKKDDPILIFYAGHGAEAMPPEGWPTRDKIQMLVPYDFVPCTNKDERAQGIPDIALNLLLSNLARIKGDNIVSIEFLIVVDVSLDFNFMFS